MNPKYPIYIISKGRWESRLTSKALEEMKVPYFIVVEEQEYKNYAEVIDPSKILILDEKYKDEYDPCIEDWGASKGSGPARNFCWDHAISIGAKRHWLMDDNIRYFLRFNYNVRLRVKTGTIFKCMEDFVDRYENVYLAGPGYENFCMPTSKHAPFIINTRIYSCILIKNDIPYRWRAKYNEDTDLSLRILKDGYCTIQFNAFLQGKVTTQVMKGGNTDEVYKKGTYDKSKMIADLHPDVAMVATRFNRDHHYVDYSRFKKNQLKKAKNISVSKEIDNYGLILVNKETGDLVNLDESGLW